MFYFAYFILFVAVGLQKSMANTNSFGFLNRDKIKWSDDKLIFPSDTFNFKPNLDPFRWSSNRPQPEWWSDRPIWGKPIGARTPKPDDANMINPCVLTSSPPDPDSKCCGVDATSNTRIVGGEMTSIEQYPWLARIEYHDKNVNIFKQLCGGFLISGRYVVSAAHCFSGEVLKLGTPVNIILGEYNTTNKGRDCVRTSKGNIVCTDGAIRVAIDKYRAHPKYVFDKVRNINDIAVVKMNETVAYTKFIRPICQPTSDVTISPPKDLRFYTAGWGAIEHYFLKVNGRRSSKMVFDEVKRHVDVPFIEHEKCRQQFTFLTKAHICAGGEDRKDACKGDSGGPLMLNNDGVFTAVGLVSTGSEKYPCGTIGHAGVYTNVYQFMDFIKECMSSF